MDVLADARALLATGPLCDACLGRPFADRSFGLTNAERGEALRTAVALADDADFEAGTDDCWVCEGACARHDEWAEAAVEALDGVAFDTYQVGTRVPPLVEENGALLREDAGMAPDAGESFKSAFNREVGKRVGGLADAAVDFDRPDVLAVLNLDGAGPEAGTHAVDVQVNPAFVYGRYRKLERGIPQTEWPCRECGGSGVQLAEDGGEEDCEHCDGAGYMYPTSVEEEVAPPVREAMDGAEAVFHGAGREDVDARMLGAGRPFVVEVKHPRERTPDVDALEDRIAEAADGVAVSDLALATHEMVERVKELDASKRYRATVEFDAPVAVDELSAAVAELDGVTVEQDTPERVDHRRASKTRVREVYAAEGRLVPAEAVDEDGDVSGDADEPGTATTAELRLHTEGGTYVKELVSGDEGRTTPNLADLLAVDAVVTALDVTDVAGEDGAFADPEYLREAEE
jgi:tRNA pseudouridine synthase 10